ARSAPVGPDLVATAKSDLHYRALGQHATLGIFAYPADRDAVQFAMDAKRHLKVIALDGVDSLADEANLVGVVGIVDTTAFVEMAKSGKVWEREG
ncbi:MAG: hypothetical protein B7Z52_05125, partial [Burkholderiales bacterium 12-64-5]